MIFDPEQSEVVTQIVDWLQTAVQPEIQEYNRRLPDEQRGSIAELREDLLAEVRQRRSQALKTFFNTNAPSVMPEHELLRMIAGFARYNAPSVLATFHQQYPKLGAYEPLTSPQEWAAGYLLLWRNLFYLLTAQSFEDYSVLLNSLIKVGINAEAADILFEKVGELLDQLDEHVSGHNFEPSLLPVGLQQAVKDLMESFTFFPSEYIKQIAFGSVALPTLSLFRAIKFVVHVFQIAAATEVNLSDNQKLSELLWDELAEQEEYDTLKAKAEYFYERQLENEEGPVYERFNQLLKAITIPTIESGVAQKYIRDYLATLDAQQKKAFLEELTDFLVRSVDMQVLFGPIDIEYFINTMKNGNPIGSRSDFINSLAERFDPSDWPRSQKAMLMLANIF